MQILDKINIIFDKFGHVYFEYNAEIYEPSIDNKNNLELMKIFNTDNFNFVILDNDETLDKQHLNLTSKSSTLKSKMIREFIEEQQHEEKHLDEIEDNELETQMHFYPEDLEYIHNNDAENLLDENIYNETNFIFYGNENDIVKVLVENDYDEINNDNSLYDTYIYKNTIDHPELSFISKNIYNSSYRIILYQDGHIVLKMIGNNKNIYKLSIDEQNNLIIKSL